MSSPSQLLKSDQDHYLYERQERFVSNELTGSEYLRVTTDIGTMNASAASLHDPEKVSDDQLRTALRDLSVDNVTTVLTAIIEDKSVRKPVRRQAVGRIVENQPHPTKHFHDFDMWNDKLRGSLVNGTGGNADKVMGYDKTAFFATIIGFLLFGLMTPLSYFFSAIAAACLGTSIFQGFLWRASYIGIKEEVVHQHKDREHMTLDEFEASEIEKQKKHVEEQSSYYESQMRSFSGESVSESSIRLKQTRQDFADAQARIASYETDMTKALSRPAFNDVTVPQVNTMVKQLRKCRSLADGVDNRSVKAQEFADAVNELWVDVAAAEQAAKRIAWSEVSEEEQKDLKLALQLVSQANDSGNTDELRANLYSRLRTVVQRLDSRGVTMPESLVLEIESRSRKEIASA